MHPDHSSLAIQVKDTGAKCQGSTTQYMMGNCALQEAAVARLQQRKYGTEVDAKGHFHSPLIE